MKHVNGSINLVCTRTECILNRVFAIDLGEEHIHRVHFIQFYSRFFLLLWKKSEMDVKKEWNRCKKERNRCEKNEVMNHINIDFALRWIGEVQKHDRKTFNLLSICWRSTAKCGRLFNASHLVERELNQTVWINQTYCKRYP